MIADVSHFVKLKEMFCVLVCHRRITVDSEDEVTVSGTVTVPGLD